jgi:hypothetical protein
LIHQDKSVFLLVNGTAASRRRVARISRAAFFELGGGPFSPCRQASGASGAFYHGACAGDTPRMRRDRCAAAPFSAPADRPPRLSSAPAAMLRGILRTIVNRRRIGQ